MQLVNTATSNPNRRTANPPISLSCYGTTRSTASSHISPHAYSTVMEEESQVIPTRITSSYSNVPRRSPNSYQSHADYLIQRNPSSSSRIVGAADLGQVAGGMRRSNSGTSVDPPTSFVKKDL